MYWNVPSELRISVPKLGPLTGVVLTDNASLGRSVSASLFKTLAKPPIQRGGRAAFGDRDRIVARHRVVVVDGRDRDRDGGRVRDAAVGIQQFVNKAVRKILAAIVRVLERAVRIEDQRAEAGPLTGVVLTDNASLGRSVSVSLFKTLAKPPIQRGGRAAFGDRDRIVARHRVVVVDGRDRDRDGGRVGDAAIGIQQFVNKAVRKILAAIVRVLERAVRIEDQRAEAGPLTGVVLTDSASLGRSVSVSLFKTLAKPPIQRGGRAAFGDRDRIVARHRVVVVDGRDRDRDGGRVRDAAVGIQHFVNKAVRKILAAIVRVLERAVRIEDQRAEVGPLTGVVLTESVIGQVRVGVVVQDAGKAADPAWWPCRLRRP